MLETTRAQSVNGFQMCRSMLLQAAIIRGEYQPARQEVTVVGLLDDHDVVHEVPHDGLFEQSRDDEVPG